MVSDSIPIRSRFSSGKVASATERGPAKREMLRTARVVRFCAVQSAGSGGLRCGPALVAIPARDERPDLAVRDRALEHPEAAVGMDVLDPSGSDRPLRGLDRARDGVGCLDFGALDVNYADTHPDLRAEILEHRQLLDRPV